MKADELNNLHKKAETRKDGIYSYRGNLWVVKSKRFIAFMTPFGIVLSRQGSFNYQIGDFSHLERWERKTKLKELIK